MFEKSPDITELAKALALAQGRMKPAAKSGKNPFFNNAKYSTLEDIWDACRVPFTENGLSVFQSPSMTEQGAVQITTMLMHASGQFLIDRLMLAPKDRSPQSVGSAISYGKRYSLAAVAGVASEDDDDGNLAQRGTREQTPATRPAQSNQKPAQTQANSFEGTTGSGQQSKPLTAGVKLSQGVSKEPRPAHALDTGIRGELPQGPSKDATPPRTEFISPKQQTRLFAIAGQNGWTNENIKTYLATHYSLNSTSEIKWKDYSGIIDIVSKFSFDSVMEKWKGDRKDIDGVAPQFDEQEEMPF